MVTRKKTIWMIIDYQLPKLPTFRSEYFRQRLVNYNKTFSSDKDHQIFFTGSVYAALKKKLI